MQLISIWSRKEAMRQFRFRVIAKEYWMRAIKYTWLLITLWLLVGCGSTIPRLDMAYKGNDSGAVVASVSNERTAYSHIALLIRPKGPPADLKDTPRGAIGYSVGFSKKPDFHIGYEHGDVQVARLPPGEYEIYGYEAVQTGLVTVTAGSDKFAPFAFSLKAGDAIYIGSFRTSVLNNRFGLPDPFSPSVRISDQLHRDLPIARAKDTSLPEVIRKNIPTAGDFRSTLFTSER
jgi:hypothetical protein